MDRQLASVAQRMSGGAATVRRFTVRFWPLLLWLWMIVHWTMFSIGVWQPVVMYCAGLLLVARRWDDSRTATGARCIRWRLPNEPGMEAALRVGLSVAFLVIAAWKASGILRLALAFGWDIVSTAIPWWWWPEVFVAVLLAVLLLFLHRSRRLVGWIAAGALALMDIPRTIRSVLEYLADSGEQDQE